MSSPFVAEIRIWGCNFAPTGWATCDGQILPISQNTALFSLLGTTYGGNGKSTFALPNLEGSAPIHAGGSQPGPGLSIYDLGQVGGTPTIALLTSEMPAHSHAWQANAAPGTLNDPANGALARSSGGTAYKTINPDVQLATPQAVGPTGGDLPHNNMMPFLTLNFCIALQGIFPPRP